MQREGGEGSEGATWHSRLRSVGGGAPRAEGQGAPVRRSWSLSSWHFLWLRRLSSHPNSCLPLLVDYYLRLVLPDILILRMGLLEVIQLES